MARHRDGVIGASVITSRAPAKSYPSWERAFRAVATWAHRQKPGEVVLLHTVRCQIDGAARTCTCCPLRLVYGARA